MIHAKLGNETNASLCNLKAGRWNAAKVSNDAECDVQVKKMLGITQTSKAGLGKRLSQGQSTLESTGGGLMRL